MSAPLYRTDTAQQARLGELERQHKAMQAELAALGARRDAVRNEANDANQTSNTAPLRAERGGVSGPKMIPSTALRGEPGGAGERRAGDDPAARTASVHQEARNATIQNTKFYGQLMQL